jgi:pimeloyl-ACP methyl ester carboxylesterase
MEIKNEVMKKAQLSFIRIIKAVFLGILLCLILLYLFQAKLIFFPAPVSPEQLQIVRSLGNNVEELTLTVKDGTKLHGWFVKGKQSDLSKVVIYFGGNAEELSCMIDQAGRIPGWSMVLINYRGYGLSEGEPSEENLCNDGLAIYDYLSVRPDVDKGNIVLMGRSLGTGVATYVAANRSAKGVILISPYDKLSSPGMDAYPLLPVDALLQHKFDSISRAPHIQAPLLVLVGTEDCVVSPKHSRKLAEKWNGNVVYEEISSVEHDTILYHDKSWKSINAFLSNIQAR